MIDQYEFPELKPGDQDWRWLHKYAYEIVTGKIPSCQKIKWMAERHFRDLQRDDIYLDEKACKSIVLWFKFIPLTDGMDAGKPTILDPAQIFIACSVIGWKWCKTTYDDDGNPITVANTRRFTQAFMLVARKWGKTTFIAGIGLYLMYKHGHRPNAFSVATKRDQAKIVWETACEMIRLSPRLKSIFEPRANDIIMPNKSGAFKPLASDSKSLDGLNPMFIVLDECHAIKDRNLYGVTVSAFGAQDEWFLPVITTAGFILDGLCTDLYKNGERVLNPDDEVDQDNYFYAIYEIDKGDDWSNPENWYKSNPGLIYGRPKMSYLKGRYQEACLTTAEKANFLTKHCNLFINGSDKWLDIDEFKNGSRDLDFNDYKNRKCYIGLDRSVVSDITAIPALFPDDDSGVTLFSFNYQSQGAVDEAGDYLKAIYHKAEAEGDLTILPGKYIRNEHIKQAVRELWSALPDCVGVYYDPYKMKQVALELEDEGIPMISVSAGPANISEPTKQLEGLIKDGLFRYNKSPLLEYAASCIMLSTSKFGNSAPYRDPNAVKVDKIDPLIAGILALSGATLMKVEQNIYESRGMITI